ncbi:serine/threonine-protein kinase [Corynebacterium macginleyi]|uniref:serine/threonine-protein kinase n=1 Tax=Corynebacterium macginleyi TaxID=38290 RepID=UPI000EFA103E|nr:serine/threonine-protein kinase [Corynebacterium macginleyi]QRJ57426.1 serine/threonine protein kinase [Corynebacterium macginleyi]QRP20885.1 serine/threonine protein kinase [Corynebacterium macginleyi]RMB65037.1 serine/threonine protein kinase [Corynebacterium macginleyi]
MNDDRRDLKQSFIDHLDFKEDTHVLRPLGNGGMGTVYLVNRRSLDRLEAIKILAVDDLKSSAELRQRFIREIRMLGSLRHPNIVRVNHCGVFPEGVPYFFMDYVEGTDLRHLITERKSQGIKFTLEESLDLLWPIAKALDYLHHRGKNSVIHRDIKPANILIPNESSGYPGAMLTDFGISISHDITSITQTGFYVGTPKYMAPELGSSDGATPNGTGMSGSAKSDGYSFALILLELLTLTSPKNFIDPATGAIDVSESQFPPMQIDDRRRLVAALQQELSNVPARRFATCSDFLDAASPISPAQRSENASALSVNDETLPESVHMNSSSVDTPVRAHTSLKKIIALIGAGSTLVASLFAGASWLRSSNDSQYPDIAAEFPQLVGNKGWRDHPCKTGSSTDKISQLVECGNSNEGYAIAKLSSTGSWSDFMPEEDIRTLSNGKCKIKFSKVSDSEVFIAPLDLTENYLIKVWGAQAAEESVNMPIC